MLVFFISIGFASANENVTENISLDDCEVSQMIDDVESDVGESSFNQLDSKIETKNITAYYKENSELVSYLKDVNNKPLSNKKVSISLNDKVYNKVTNSEGKIVLKLNLKPGAYTAAINFKGDDNYTQCSSMLI